VRKLESSVENSFVRKCKRLGVWQIKFGVFAFPDRLVLCKGGQLVWVEFKRPGETLRKNQEIKIRKLRNWGFTVEVIDNNEEAKALAQKLSEKDSKASS